MTIETISLISILLGFACSLIIMIDLLNHGQKMWIMNIVWPVTALYASVIGLWAYYSFGRMKKVKMNENGDMRHHEHMQMHEDEKTLTWKQIAKGTLHCGSGCTMGDIIAESILVSSPLILFGKALFGSWLVEYFFALAIGIVFQYFAIKPMKNLSAGQALKAAFKADVLSLTCWQIGMYGWMSISVFLIFRHELKPDDPLFWFMMQAGMLLGFVTAYPVNYWLMKKGIKEAM